MIARTDYFEFLQAADLSLVNTQELANRFTGGHSCAPQKPLGANFEIFSEHGGLVDTCKATCPPPAALALNATPSRLEAFNLLALNAAPEIPAPAPPAADPSVSLPASIPALTPGKKA